MEPASREVLMRVVVVLLLVVTLLALPAALICKSKREPERVATPVISPPEGRYADSLEVAISCATPGAEIWYTLEGEYPQKPSGYSLSYNPTRFYRGPFRIPNWKVVRAIATSSTKSDSEVSTVRYRGIPPCIVASFQPLSGHKVLSLAPWGSKICASVDGFGLEVLEHATETSTRMGIADSYPLPEGSSRGLAVQGNLAYLAAGSAGFYILDLASWSFIDRRSDSSTPDVAVDVAVAGDYAYVLDTAGGLLVYDCSDPSTPYRVGACPEVRGCLSVAVRGDYACLTEPEYGLRVVDVSDPASPRLVGSCATENLAFAVAVAGEYAYVACGREGLAIVDISEPAQPWVLTYCTTPGEVADVCIVGNKAYVADVNCGLVVFDISDPRDIGLAGSCLPPGYATFVTVTGKYAWLATWESDLYLIELKE